MKITTIALAGFFALGSSLALAQGMGGGGGAGGAGAGGAGAGAAGGAGSAGGAAGMGGSPGGGQPSTTTQNPSSSGAMGMATTPHHKTHSKHTRSKM
jgi:hypothetical protein